MTNQNKYGIISVQKQREVKQMKDKKMPYAVFVLQWIENRIEDGKKSGQDEFDVLDDLVYDCRSCPLSDKCERCASTCTATLKKYVESAE